MKLKLNNVYDWPMGLRIAIVFGIALIVFLFGYWWDLGALSDELAHSKNQESELKLQFESGVRREKKLDEELLRFDQMRSVLIAWKKKIINHSQLPEALNEILKIGGVNGLYFTLFSPGEESKEAEYRRLPIKAIVVGDYHQIGSFLSQVANLPWIVVIGDFSITNETKADVIGPKLAEQAKVQNLLMAELNFDIYHYPDPNELIIIEPPKPGAKPTAKPTNLNETANAPKTTP